MLRLVDSAEDVQQMAAEGVGGLSFRFAVGGVGELNRAAENGDTIARDLAQICAFVIGYTIFALPGMVRCALCDGPFAIDAEAPWALLLAHASTPEPTLACCSAICSGCMAMDAGELQHRIMCVYRTAFPRLQVIHVAEAGHA